MKQLAIILAALIAMCTGFSQDNSNLRKKHYNIENGLAIEGYDPVAYFTQGKPVKGNKELAVSHQGVLYYFANVENKELFKKTPGKYEPAYGGWCAYAMGAKGEKVSVDPKTFKIVNGKLNLFYNKLFNNTLTDWNKDEANLKRHAEENWQKIFQ